MHKWCIYICTIASKINGTRVGFYLPISKLNSILAVTNLLENKISQNYYSCKISLQSAAVNCSFCDNLTLLEVATIYFADDGTKKK